MTEAWDCIIVGGGAVGAACTRELARSGRRVLVLDAGGLRGEAWRAAAGMLAPQIEAHEDDVAFDLGLLGRERYREIEPELRAATGEELHLWYEGIARLAADEADATVLRQRVACQRQGGHRCDWLDADEVRDRWPWIGPTFGALWAPQEGALDPERLVAALHQDAAAHGAVRRTEHVTSLEIADGRVVAVRGRERYVAPTVVLASGAWTGQIEGLPRPISVEPVRGQMAAFPWPDGVPRAILYHRDCYLLYRGGAAICGSTMESVGFDATTTDAGIARVLDAARRIAPPLAAVEPIRTWAGLRPMTPDGLPILGQEPRCEGLWYATGHGRNGILLAGITGHIMRQWLDGEDPGIDGLDAMRPDRFWQW